MVTFVISLTFANFSPLARAAMVKPVAESRVPLYGNKALNVIFIATDVDISEFLSNRGVLLVDIYQA